MKNNLLSILLFIFLGTSLCYSQAQNSMNKIILENGEKVWAGVIYDGYLMPVSGNYSMDFYGNNKANQVQPLILTSKGQYVWSEQPYKFEVSQSEINITDPYNSVVTGRSGSTLSEVQRFVSNKYFPASGLLPDTLLFAAPQYNTWIELN